MNKYYRNSGPTDRYACPGICRLTAEKYRQWLQLLVDGNQNMVRIWGGGIYEPDVFYDICDGPLHAYARRQKRSAQSPHRTRNPSLAGLYVRLWAGDSRTLRSVSDHVLNLFQYPAYESFTKSVEVEAEQNVKRLRHHPSIVIFGK